MSWICFSLAEVNLWVMQTFEQSFFVPTVTQTHESFENCFQVVHAPTEPRRLSYVWLLCTYTVDIFWERNKITPQTHIRNFEIPFICSFSFRLIWYTFLNRKNSKSLWFYWYCLRNEGFQFFRCHFGEWFLLLSQKKLPVQEVDQRHNPALFCLASVVTVTFSQKGIKITHQNHIWKFEILHFSDRKSVKSQWIRIFSVPKSVP